MKMAASGTLPWLSVKNIAMLLLIINISGCDCNRKVPSSTPDWRTYLIESPYRQEKTDPYKQLIVWLKPDSTGEQFSRWLQDSVVKKGNKDDLKIRFVCGSCDSSLFLLEGKAVEVYMQGDVAKGGNNSKSKTKVTGESGPIYFSTNLPVHFPENTKTGGEGKPSSIETKYSDTVVKVAVFDTGLEPGLLGSSSYIYKATDSACMPGANTGWNFTEGNNNWMDNNPQRHGTTVAKFITNEIEKYQQNSIEILPVKVFGSDGTGDLFSILCGFAYARNRKVDIINASFGFYESIHKYDISGKPLADFTSPVLLKAFIDYYLTRNNILLIAAAGNKNDAIEDPEYNPSDSLQKRNLDSVHFYPASLSPELPNIISVTTVYKDKVSPTQNFSSHVVDVGVTADGIDSIGSFVFINPINSSLKPVSGSSFAAPVVTGKFTAWYHLYKPLLRSTALTNAGRDSIFLLLRNNAVPSFLYNEQGLLNKIKEGKVINKTVSSNILQKAAYRKK